LTGLDTEVSHIGRMIMNRRLLLLSAGSFIACAGTQSAAAADKHSESSPWRKMSDAQWRRRLSPAAYRVLRKEDTERPGSSPFNHEKRRGTFICAGCDLPLFKSDWKYDSGTGWPSFFRAIESNVGKKQDLVLLIPRTEYHCARCLGHQGHLFPDGPRPTGLRWCNNGVALKFVPA